MAEPGASEPHQLLTTDGQRRQHRRQLDVLNQQTVQQSQDQDAEDAKTELEQPQTESETDSTHKNAPLAHTFFQKGRIVRFFLISCRPA